MAADILVFNAHEVPVGRDQIQHIEMARVIGQRFNHLYADELAQKGVSFTLPEARIDEQVATLPGLDGRKMSKSYNNTIPLFDPPAKLRSAIMGIVTDSRAPGEAKDADTSNIFAIYQAFAMPDETAAMRAAFAAGIGWGDAKQKLFERIDEELGPLRERYDALIAKPARIEDLLLAGADKARARSKPFVDALRWAAGIRRLTDVPATTTAKAQTSALPQLKSYRENDGKFYFKLADADGAVLFQSRGFDAPKEAGQLTAALVDAGDDRAAQAALLNDVAGGDETLQVDAIAAALAALKVDKLARERAKNG
jgi:tryptophanyl-tRNA synthetase